MEHDGVVTEPRCPRCGYDLSGAVDAWRDRCPVTGVCSECGHEHRWRDVLNPGFAFPAWFIENPSSRFTRAFVGTLARCPSPGRLWSAVWMSHPIRFSRLVGFVVACALGGYFLLQGLVWIGTPRDARALFQDAILGGAYQWLLLLEPLTALADVYERGDEWLWLVMIWSVLVPFAFVALVHTRRVARIRGAHLVRAWGYSVPVVLCVTLAVSLFRVAHVNRLPPWWGTIKRQMIPAWERGFWVWTREGQGPIVLALGGAAIGWYWWRVIERYMLLRQPKATLAIVMTISFLAALAVEEFSSGVEVLSEIALKWGL